MFSVEFAGVRKILNLALEAENPIHRRTFQIHESTIQYPSFVKPVIVFTSILIKPADSSCSAISLDIEEG